MWVTFANVGGDDPTKLLLLIYRYGTEKLFEHFNKLIKENEVEFEDRYLLVIKSPKIDVDIWKVKVQSWEDKIEYFAVVFSCNFELIDLDALKVGGQEYLAAKESFEKKK